jgi:hypothetical protein
MSLVRTAIALAAGLILASCAATTRIDAAGDIHAFLISIRDGDRTTFNAHVDRPALKAQLRERLIAEAAKRRDVDPAAAALAALLAGPLVDVAADQLIQPQVFLTVAEYFGYKASTPIPNQLLIARALRGAGDDQVCAVSKKDGPCLLVFRNEDGVWRLVEFEGDAGMLKAPRLR